MKKLLIALLLCCITYIASTQNNVCYYFSNKIITQCDATIYIDEELEKSYGVFVKLPSYYDFELFKMTVNSKVREYTDIFIITNWTYNKQDNRYYLILSVSDERHEMFIAYESGEAYFLFPKK